MPYSSGTYSLPSGNPVVTGTTISSSTTNTTNSDIATALSTCVLKDGTQTITANLPMASHKLTGLSAGTTAGDSVEYGGSPSFTNLAYTGTLTGSTGILNIGSGQLYKDASGNVGIGTSSPTQRLTVIGSSQTIYFGSATRGILSQDSSGRTQFIAVNPAVTAFHPLTIDALDTVFATSSTERMRLDSSGRLLIAATSIINNADTAPLQVSGGAVTPIALRGGTNGYQIAFYNSAGTAVIGSVTGATGSTTAYNTASDQRLKENIVDAPSALASVNAIKVRSFDWKVDGSHQEYGYIAQELLEVAPEAVHVPSNEDEMMGVDFGRLTPRLVKAIQEQQAIISDLKSRLEKAGL